jgi:hypothetical protein
LIIDVTFYAEFNEINEMKIGQSVNERHSIYNLSISSNCLPSACSDILAGNPLPSFFSWLLVPYWLRKKTEVSQKKSIIKNFPQSQKKHEFPV